MSKKNKIKDFYGVNLRYEFRTHKNVGRDYGKVVSSGERYETCSTYIEWREHIYRQISHLGDSDRVNFLRFLKRIKLEKERERRLYEILLLPVSLAVVSILGDHGGMDVGETCGGFLILIFLCVLYALLMSNCEDKIDWLDDFIEVVNDVLIEKEKKIKNIH